MGQHPGFAAALGQVGEAEDVEQERGGEQRIAALPKELQDHLRVQKTLEVDVVPRGFPIVERFDVLDRHVRLRLVAQDRRDDLVLGADLGSLVRRVVEDDAVAAQLYSLVTTYYVFATGVVVAGVALLGRWAVRLLLYHKYGAHDALPWLALGWALYGLYLIFVVISGRARRTRRNLPAALAGLAVNIGALFLLVPVWGISGAGIALVLAYVVMIAVIYGLTRSLFTVGFEFGRLARLLGVLIAVSVGGELLLPTSGAAGFLLRGVAWCLIFPLLRAVGFFNRAELARIGALAYRIFAARRRTT